MIEKTEKLIVVTRPQEEALETANFFELRGLKTHIAPVMEIIYKSYNPDFLIQYDGFIATSQQALKALRGEDWCKGKQLFAFGEKTLSLAKAKGFDVHELSGHDIEEALPDLMRRLKEQPSRICYLRGVDISYDLKSICAAEGAHMDEVILYETKPYLDPIILPDSSHYAILVFSERSAERACQLVNVPSHKKIEYFCLSQKIKNSIEKSMPSVKGSVFAPEIPTTHHLYDLLLRTFL